MFVSSYIHNTAYQRQGIHNKMPDTKLQIEYYSPPTLRSAV
jgi:hypothetical protein